MRTREALLVAIMTIALTGWQGGGPAVKGMSNVSAASSEQELEKLLESFADAWNRHDVNALMSMMTDDGVFEASSGTEVNGQRYEGPKAVRAAYEAVFAQFPDARWNNPRHFVKGNRGVSEWTFTGTLQDGRRVEVTGCDLFTFRDGRIAVKNSYRKNRGSSARASSSAPAEAEKTE
jgi:ketosteroid isomerase-like protein